MSLTRIYNVMNEDNLSEYNNNLATAVAAIGSTETKLSVTSTPTNLTTNLTIPSNIHLDWGVNCPITVASGVILTISGSLTADSYQIFNGDGGVDSLSTAYPEWFGAVGDGVTDDYGSIQKAFNSSNNIKFSDGSYLISSNVTKTSDNVLVDFGNSTIINSGATYCFTFGTSADTYQNEGLYISGGNFTQANPSTTSNLSYILVRAVKSFTIKDMVLNNVSNGGIQVNAGAEDGLIDNVTINGATNYSTIRGIWLNGSTSSDYADQLVDTNSITRNATAVPTYAVENVTVSNCKVHLPAYGVYCMNTRKISILNNLIDVSGDGSKRCIAINNYSPDAIITGNTLISDRSSTGILITQYSLNVIVSDNLFKGSFGGNRAIYVQYLAEALVKNNVFTDTGTQHIEIDMGGFCTVDSNSFLRLTKTDDHRVIYLKVIESGSSFGSTATVVSGGVIFKNNIVSRVGIGVLAIFNNAHTGGNEPCCDILNVVGNTFKDVDTTPTAGEYIVNLTTGSSGNIQNYYVRDNTYLPYTTASRKYVKIASGTEYLSLYDDAVFASYLVDATASAGTITITKLSGGAISLGVSRSGNDLLLVPRTMLGASGAQVPPVMGLVDDTAGTAAYFHVTDNGTNYLVSAYTTAGAKIPASTDQIKFVVLLGPFKNT